MARRCELTGKGVMTGHLVSHANNKTKRTFRPNLNVVRFPSETLGETVRFRIAASTLRSVDKLGGIDAFLLKARDETLSLRAQRVKREIQKRHAAA